MLINGKEAHSAITDRAFHYGDGLFETLYFPKNISLNDHPLWPYHLKRLQEGCCVLDLACPSIDLLMSEIEAIRKTFSKGIVKLILSRAQEGRGYKPSSEAFTQRTLMGFETKPSIPESVLIKKSTVVASEQPLLAGIKHLNRLECVLAAREIEPPLFERVLCSSTDQVVEGTRTNLFALFDNRWLTPTLQTAGVKGVARACLLTKLKAQGMQVSEEDFSYHDLKKAKSIFLCNSVLGVVPVHQIEDIPKNTSGIEPIQGIWNTLWA